jgi:hypothetical protein
LTSKKVRQLSEFGPGEEFEGGLRGVVAVALGLARLHRVEDAGERGVALLRGDAHLGEASDEVRLARLVRHRHDAGVADEAGSTCS